MADEAVLRGERLVVERRVEKRRREVEQLIETVRALSTASSP
jgi:hypothetical protein